MYLLLKACYNEGYSMLSLEDKEKQWELFRDGAQFGKHT
jgi:hypothetical protein